MLYKVRRRENESNIINFHDFKSGCLKVNDVIHEVKYKERRYKMTGFSFRFAEFAVSSEYPDK